MNEPALSISELTGRIQDEYEASRQSAHDAVQHAINVGLLLNQSRGVIKHGQWESWVDDNFEFTTRTAQNYMRLAGNAGLIEEAKAKRVSLLTVRDALQVVAEHEAKPPARSCPQCGARMRASDTNTVCAICRGERKLGGKVEPKPEPIQPAPTSDPEPAPRVTDDEGSTGIPDHEPVERAPESDESNPAPVMQAHDVMDSMRRTHAFIKAETRATDESQQDFYLCDVITYAQELRELIRKPAASGE
jgi:hypothetical protein